MRYPEAPGHKAPIDTSEAAAISMIPIAPSIRYKVYASLFQYGPQTADEVAGKLGLSILSVRPRFSELAASGRLIDTGDRRSNSSGKMAKVWKIINVNHYEAGE